LRSYSSYPSYSFDIARPVNQDPPLGERVNSDGPEIWAQVVYTREYEWAETVDDVLRRRTTLTVRGPDTGEVP
jgi:glycerol-3-phosphate dehydrogenase